MSDMPTISTNSPEKRTISIFAGKQSLEVDYLLEKTYAREEDIVIVSGTLIEGIGTKYSDFDVYVIGDKRPKMKDVQTSRHHWIYNSDDNITTGKEGELIQLFDYIHPGNLAWDVEYWTENETLKLFAEMHQNYVDALSHTRNVFSLSYKTSGFLHRLFAAIPLQNGDKFTKLLAKLSKPELCFLLFRQYIGGYPIFRDIKGSWSDDDLDTAYQMSLNFLTDQAFALTFLELDSNPNKKWLFKKLAQLSASNRHIADRYIELNFRGAGNSEEKRRNILDAMDLVDTIFDACRALLRTNSAFFDPELALRLIKEEQLSRSSPHRELDNQFLFRRKIFSEGMPSCADLLQDRQ
jgi:hypothetical protein